MYYVETVDHIMGSETGGNVRTSLAVDSDGSDTWEDFFGTSTDLVPQLLGMFDELARRSSDNADHVVLPSCNIPAALQKRLSLLPRSHRSSLLGPLYASESFMASQRTNDSKSPSRTVEAIEITVEHVNRLTKDDTDSEIKPPNHRLLQEYPTTGDSPGDKTAYNGTSNGSSPLRYNRRCRAGGRPLSGSSIASSTSSSSCSNQGITSATNPYLASVESLADTCASSQGSADSGVVTVSDTICRGDTEVVSINQRRDSAEREPSTYLSRPRYCDPHRNPVERVLLEIVDTEAVYVEHLRQVIQGYLIFWRDDPRSLVDQPHLCDLFSNIEDIYEFNSEFLKEIETCGLDAICVANTFVKHNSGFKVYTEYCTNYPRTVSVLTELMGQERTAYAFRERQAALGHALPLGSFLLKPVQRILKYHLLLQNLSKECDAEGDDSAISVTTINAIDSALTAMTGIARHINVMKRKHEHAVRVQEIQSLLYGWHGPDLTTSGELVAEGRFRMRGAKAPRHVFLFDRMLLLTKKKEDGVLVYKAHIMCSNLMLIESIPGEALSFHVIPFDNPRLQYTLQARNLEQKREWTMQIKRVIIENYNAVIPSHARQLVMELGQTQPEDDTTPDRSSAKKQHSAPPEYLEKRKQERERRKSETGFKQRLRKPGRKSEVNAAAAEVSSAVWHFATLLDPESPLTFSSTNMSYEDSPNGSRKNESTESVANTGRDQSLNRSADGRAAKVKDRFASWRRKSEPGFQSYVSLNQSDEEEKDEDEKDDDEKDSEAGTETTIVASTEAYDDPSQDAVGTTPQPLNNSPPPLPPVTKETNEKQEQAQTMEEIVGHILMQNRDFQKLLEKQRPSSIINMRQQQRFKKHISVDTSDDSETEQLSYGTETMSNNRGGRTRNSRREQRIVRANNARNSTSPPVSRDEHPLLRLRYDNLRADGDKGSSSESTPRVDVKNRTNRINEKRAIFEAFKRQSIVTESKVIQTALRIRENTNVESNRETLDEGATQEKTHDKQTKTLFSGEENDQNVEKARETDESRGFGNYDNLHRVWESGAKEHEQLHEQGDSPTEPAIWLTKLCEGLPTATQKCGSLPRSFQMNQDNHSAYPNLTKSRFLQRDGKPMHERPFTIASDKPAEINLEDMERYASSCQPEGRIAKFPTSASTSTFFCSLDEAFTDDYSSQVLHATSSGNVHPDYKIYRPNGSPGTMLKNVLSRAGSRLQGLRSTESIDTLECQTDELERSKSRSGSGKLKKKHKFKSSRESSSDVDDITGGCVGASPFKVLPTTPSAYYQQGSSGLGARIAQSDYADPAVLFGETKRLDSLETTKPTSGNEDVNDANSSEQMERRESEADSFYERSFEAIENYVDGDADEVFRDSAIFSDMDEVSAKFLSLPANSTPSRHPLAKPKVAPPVPVKRKPENSTKSKPLPEVPKVRPSVARKPEYLRAKSQIREHTSSYEEQETSGSVTTTRLVLQKLRQVSVEEQSNQMTMKNEMDQEKDDVSAGQSRAGWVRKMVGQLQGQPDT